MSKFNQSTKGSRITENKCGHVAYKMDDELKLATMVLTSMFGEPKFYGDNTNELVELAQKANPEYVAKLAIYARKVAHLRSVSHALCSIVARNGNIYTKQVVSEIVERADDITEILACYISLYGKPIPNALKKALATQMNKFNEYSFAKYNGGSKAIKFRDVLRLVHPVAKNETQNTIFKKIIDDALETPYTWEVELSARGNTKEVWEELLDSGKVGHMALLRNMKNIILAKPNNIQIMYDRIMSKDEVLKSKQMPFRFFSAYQTLQLNNIVERRAYDALEIAIGHSVENMERIHGRSLIAIDVSGSMRGTVSSKSTVKCSDIARLIAVMANKICDDAVVVSFDTLLRAMVIPTVGGIIGNAMAIPVCGGGTNLSLPLEYAIKTNQHFDRMIMFSDNEINYGYTRTCQSLADNYRGQINPDFWVHAVDLQGYGTQQFIGKNTNVIAGWSENVLPFVNKAEHGISTIVDEIKQINL